MKTKLHLLSLLLIPALLTSCPEKGGSGTSALRVAVCQPESLETVPALMDSLKHALAENKQAGSAGLEVRVIVAEDEIVTIPAPKVESVMVNLFGPSTPYALQKKLEAHLAAVEERLKAGCPARPVSLATLKSAPQALYGAEAYVVWALQGDSRSVWSGAERAPKAVVTDAETLADTLDAASTRNLLVLNSSVKAPVVIAAKKPAKKAPVVAKTKAAPVSPTKALKPVAAKPTPAQPERVAAKVGDSQEVPSPSATSTTKTPQVIMQPGGSVIVNVGRDSEKSPATGGKARIDLPADAEPIGAPILFERGKPTPINKAELERISLLIKELKTSFDFRIVITSRADAEKGSTENRNQELSEQRADTCKAFMLEHGIPVHQTICIGDALAESTADHERKVCFYVIDKVERKLPDTAATANR